MIDENTKRATRVSRLLAWGVLAAASTPAPTLAQTQVIIITGSRPPCCSYSISFDTFMSSYTRPYSTSSFDAPEGEAFMVAGWGSTVKKPVTPTAAMELHSCNAVLKGNQAAMDITKDSLDFLRQPAATQLYFATFPNFVNTQRDGLRITVTFGDGSKETYRHLSAGRLDPVPDTFVPGNGVPRSACSG